jgi:thiol-disulfide isomerase/thioredoxin
MTARKQWTIVGAIVVVLAAGLAVTSHFLRDQLFPVTEGSDAPNFRAKVLGENRYKTLADYKGQVVLLNIWATWCGPCQVEIPSLQRLYQAYGDKGLKLVAVSIDDYVGEDSIRAFAKHFGVTFEATTRRTRSSAPTRPRAIPKPSSSDARARFGESGSALTTGTPGNRALIAQLLGLQQPKTVANGGDR